MALQASLLPREVVQSAQEPQSSRLLSTCKCNGSGDLQSEWLSDPWAQPGACQSLPNNVTDHQGGNFTHAWHISPARAALGTSSRGVGGVGGQATSICTDNRSVAAARDPHGPHIGI